MLVSGCRWYASVVEFWCVFSGNTERKKRKHIKKAREREGKQREKRKGQRNKRKNSERVNGKNKIEKVDDSRKRKM